MLSKLMMAEKDEFIQDVLDKIISLYKLSKTSYEKVGKLVAYMDLIGIIMEAEYEQFQSIKKCRVSCFALLVE
jgi:hypothetical protein